MPAKPRRSSAAPAAAGVSLQTPSQRIDLAWPAAGTKALATRKQRVIEWSNIVRNRTRWARTATAASALNDLARRFLLELGLTETQREALAAAPMVRVAVPFAEGEAGWEARILPWEYVLSAGTRDLRSGQLMVTRWLPRDRATTTARLDRVLFVESVPGRLAATQDFADECRLVAHTTRASVFERLVSPTGAQLAEAVARLKPGIVHLAGFDAHQGLALLDDPRAAEAADGYLLAGPGGAVPIEAAALAEVLVAGRTPPTVVYCNLWNSAARLAPALAAAGASHVVGFQDGIDDGLAELFVGHFYRTLAAASNVTAGFDAAWTALQSQRKPLRGTGIVLWQSGTAAQLAAMPAPDASSVSVAVPMPMSRSALVAPDVAPADIRTLLAVTVEPEPEVSYGLLHNNRDLFRKFLLRNLGDAPLHGIEVFVELHANDGTYPYRQTVTLDGPVLDLSREIKIALTSTLARSLDELLRTSLFVRLRVNGEDVYTRTFPVTLAPVDQWADTDTDRQFLPSFVFPRDRAVMHAIRNAEQFVTALRDDPAAGFDGYQSLDPDADDPAWTIDRQVQALWYSTLYRVPPSYINPPPSYSVASQRIRTPSEIVAGGFGTCIDLALMVAAVLEAVEIYPVIFLLNDHAFPGFWRTDSAREEFLELVASSASATALAPDGVRGDGLAATAPPPVAWSFDASTRDAIVAFIERGDLVPLESVSLTARESLSVAIDTGRGYFAKRERKRFLCMLDVRTAREQGVTPLPLGARLGRETA